MCRTSVESVSSAVAVHRDIKLATEHLIENPSETGRSRYGIEGHVHKWVGWSTRGSLTTDYIALLDLIQFTPIRPHCGMVTAIHEQHYNLPWAIIHIDINMETLSKFSPCIQRHVE